MDLREVHVLHSRIVARRSLDGGQVCKAPRLHGARDQSEGAGAEEGDDHWALHGQAQGSGTGGERESTGVYIQPDRREEGAQSELCNYVRTYVRGSRRDQVLVCVRMEKVSQSPTIQVHHYHPQIRKPSWGPAIVLCRYA